MTDRTFPKRERLCAKKDIDRLFRTGRALKKGVVVLKWLVEPNAEAQVQVLISVPKRRVPKAVDRNRIKRRLRALYQLNKIPPETVQNRRLLLALIYGGAGLLHPDKLEEDYLRAREGLMRVLDTAGRDGSA